MTTKTDAAYTEAEAEAVLKSLGGKPLKWRTVSKTIRDESADYGFRIIIVEGYSYQDGEEYVFVDDAGNPVTRIPIQPKGNWGGKRPNQTGRPPKPKAQKLHPHLVSFTDTDWAEIQKMAQREGSSAAEVVRQAVESYCFLYFSK